MRSCRHHTSRLQAMSTHGAAYTGIAAGLSTRRHMSGPHTHTHCFCTHHDTHALRTPHTHIIFAHTMMETERLSVGVRARETESKRRAREIGSKRQGSSTAC